MLLCWVCLQGLYPLFGSIPLVLCSDFVLLGLCFEVYFVRLSIAPPAFYVCFHLHGMFSSFTFSLRVSFVLRWVSCRQHIHGSCFLIHSATLCLLIGEFNSFTLKVIIDRYIFIAFYSLYLYLSLSIYFFLSSS